MEYMQRSLNYNKFGKIDESQAEKASNSYVMSLLACIGPAGFARFMLRLSRRNLNFIDI